jgi:ligand-binding sensor domain-containing protein
MKFIYSLTVLLLTYLELSAQSLEYYKYDEESSLDNSEITCMTKNKNEILFLGTSNGIKKYNSSKFYGYNINDSILNNYIISIAELENIIYFSTMNGLYSYDGKVYKNIVNDHKIYNLCSDTINNEIYYSKENSIFKISANSLNPKPIVICSFKEKNTIIKYIHIESESSIYISTLLGLYQKTKSDTLKKISSINSYFTYLDKNKILYQITRNTIEQYNDKHQLISSTKYRDDYFKKYNINTTAVKVYATFSNDRIYILSPILTHNSINIKDKKLLDIINNSRNIFQIDISTKKINISNISQPSGFISPTSILSDSKGNLWISTLNGLHQYIIPEKRYTYNYILM